TWRREAEPLGWRSQAEPGNEKRDPMLRYLPSGLGVVALIACGIVHGVWTDRWARAADTNGLAAKLRDLPLSVGDWHGENLEGDTRGLGPIAGFLQRRYVNERTGAVVTVALVCGRPGPV